VESSWAYGLRFRITIYGLEFTVYDLGRLRFTVQDLGWNRLGLGDGVEERRGDAHDRRVVQQLLQGLGVRV